MMIAVRGAALLALVAGLTGAQRSPAGDDVSGWWRATVYHGGQFDDLYLHFQTRGAKQVASFSIPSVGTDDYPISLYSISPTKVDMKSIGWVLKRESDGTLRGSMSEQLAPVYAMPLEFKRSSAPVMWPKPTPAGSPPRPLWSTETHAAIVGDLVFDPARRHVLAATVSGHVMALDPATGKTVWRTDVGAPVRAAPVVSGTSLFVGGDDRGLKLDAGSGRVIWSMPWGAPKKPMLPITDPNSRWDHYSATPLLADGVAYFGARDGCVHAVAAATGRKIMDYCAKDSITSRPVVREGRIYYASFDGHVTAARLRDGVIVWMADAKGAVPRDLDFAGNKIIAGSRSYDLLALDVRSGKPAWTRYIWWSWVESVPNLRGDDMLIGSSDSLRLYHLNAATGRQYWATRLPGWAWARPARGAGLIYEGVVGTTMPYVGKREGGLAAVDERTGRFRWFLTGQHGDKDATYGFAAAPVIVGGTVYAADLNGRVVALPAG